MTVATPPDAPFIEQQRLERAINWARWAGAALAAGLGPLFPNLGQAYVAALAVFLVAYGIFARWLFERVRTPAEQERVAQLSFASDALVVTFAMLIFSPDRDWTTFVVGVLLVITGAFRLRDRVRGLLGADDYVVKPFSPRELVARVDAVLRRARASAPRRGVVERAEVRIDLSARRVTRGGSEVRLTPTEFNLLAELATHPGEALGHETLLGRVWGSEYRTETHYLKVYVGRLRDKLERDPANPRLILTVRGIGYRFADAGEAPA